MCVWLCGCVSVCMCGMSVHSVMYIHRQNVVQTYILSAGSNRFSLSDVHSL